MSTPDLVLALDQGTTSTRAIAFRAPQLAPAATARRDLAQHFPASGWVEHAPDGSVRRRVGCCARRSPRPAAAPRTWPRIGITNQRETTVVWDRAHRQADPPRHRLAGPPHRRGLRRAARGRARGDGDRATGLLLDPYFSATKIAWLLDNVAARAPRPNAGKLAFGTIDRFLLWRLTGGRCTRPTRPMPAARCSTTSTAAPGT